MAIIGGIIPRAKKVHDTRFSLTRNFGAPSLDIPARYSVEDQKGDVMGPREQYENFCSACTTSEIGADEHGIAFSQKFQALCISLIIGRSLYIQGATIDDAMKSGRTYGFLPLDKEPDAIRLSDDPAFICEPSNWPAESFSIALQYRIPGGDFVVDGPYDHFDNYRSQLYMHKPDNGISFGMPWRTSISMSVGGVVKSLWGSVSWHDVAVKGWEVIDGKTYIIIRSWNKLSGDKSYFKFDRDIFNALAGTPGAIGKMYKNIDENLINDLKERPLAIHEQILNLYRVILFKLQINLRSL